MRNPIFRLASGVFAAALWSVSDALRSQDLTITPIDWLEPFDDAPDTLPTARGLTPPAVPDQIRNLAEPAYAQERFVIDAFGKVLMRDPASTSPWLEAAVQETRSHARYQPARRGSEPVASEVAWFLIFNPKSASPKAPNATPRLLKIVSPVNPNGTSKDAPTGTVMVEAHIDAAGRVTDTRAIDEGVLPAYKTAAADAVRSWTFAPARADGEPVAATVRVPVLFAEPTVIPVSSAHKPPKPLKRSPPLYPIAMRKAGLVGETTIGFIVTVEGRVREAHVVRSNNPYFDQPAIDCVLRWTFEPARIGERPVNCHMRVPIVFTITGKPTSDLYSVRHDPKQLAKLPSALQWDHPPEFTATSFAAYPFEQLQTGTEGEVKVNFIVGPSGRVIQTGILSSPHPAFSHAVQAMLDTFEFKPAAKEGKPSLALLSFTVRFDKSGSLEAPVTPETRSLLRSLEKNPGRFVKLSELDAMPRPTSRRPPVFPSALKSELTEGDALIEFIIDRDGAVHAPRILSASREEFGYAAAQAAATWKFAPPKKDGRAVDVIARQPFSFNRTPRPEAGG
ncbi:MAG TPA: TonB family protein [Opitutaceae bacterium]